MQPKSLVHSSLVVKASILEMRLVKGYLPNSFDPWDHLDQMGQCSVTGETIGTGGTLGPLGPVGPMVPVGPMGSLRFGQWKKMEYDLNA